MNQLSKIFFTIASIGIVASCGSDSDSNNSEESLSYNIQMQNDEEAVFDDASIKIQVYGTDRRVADNPATLISETVLDIGSIPSILTLTWPENDYQLIAEPPVSTQEDAVYYLNITIDSNKDGVLCSGDYRQDYDMTPFFTINEIPSETLKFYVISIDSGSCQEF